jgi:hypothetical protein
MTQLAAIGYEGAPGAAVVESQWNHTFSGTWQYSTGLVAGGTTGAKVTTQGIARRTLAPSLTGVRLRTYYQVPDTTPTANVTMIPFRAGSTVLAGLRHTTVGTLQLIAGSSATGDASAQLVGDEPIRIEWAAFATGVLQAELWRGPRRHSNGDPDEVLTGAWTAAAGDNIGACWTTALTGWECYFDEVAVTDTPATRIGPSSSPFAAPGGVRADAIGPRQVDVSWNPVSGVSSYKIEREGAVIATGVTDNPYADLTAQPSTSYDYRVKGVV